MQPLLATIQKACRPGLWTQAVNLVRTDSVEFESRTADEIVARVKAPGQTWAATPVLYPSEGEWTCNCAGTVDPCAHVAALVLALQQETEAEQKA